MAIGLIVFTTLAYASSPVKVIDGRVDKVNLKENKLTLAYRHPVSREEEKLVLELNKETGFSEGARLENLKKGDLLTVDYKKGSETKAQAILIKRVPIRGIPKDLSR